jgi:hypothetical protein
METRVSEVSLDRIGGVLRRERQLKSNQARRKARLARKNILSTSPDYHSGYINGRMIEKILNGGSSFLATGVTRLRDPYVTIWFEVQLLDWEP